VVVIVVVVVALVVSAMQHVVTFSNTTICCQSSGHTRHRTPGMPSRLSDEFYCILVLVILLKYVLYYTATFVRNLSEICEFRFRHQCVRSAPLWLTKIPLHKNCTIFKTV